MAQLLGRLAAHASAIRIAVMRASLVFAALALTGCGDDMRLHTQTTQELERSLERIMKRLPPDEADAFDQALQDIVILGLDVGMPESYLQARSRLAVFHGETRSQSAPALVAAMVEAIRERWTIDRVRHIRENAAARLDRKTPEDIIHIAAKARMQAQANQAARWAKLEQDAETAYRNLHGRIQAVLSRETRERELRAIHVGDIVLMARERNDRMIPVATFMLRNTGDFTPTTLWLSVEVQSPDQATRSLIMHYRVPGGLRPNITQRHSVTLAEILEALLGPGHALSGLELTIEPVAAADLRGRMIGPADIAELTFDRLAILRDLNGIITAANEGLVQTGTGTTNQ